MSGLVITRFAHIRRSLIIVVSLSVFYAHLPANGSKTAFAHVAEYVFEFLVVIDFYLDLFLVLGY